MVSYKADLHIHTVLSPCGDLEMSPVNIIRQAVDKKIDIIGITDHNSLKQVEIIQNLAAAAGIFVLGGVEITTREEIHCLAFFPNKEAQNVFQAYLDDHLPVIPNIDGKMGYQVVADANDQILEMEERWLVAALNTGIDEVQKEVHRLGGIFIPAHIDRPVFSVFSQLGFIPPGLLYDALEISCYATENEVRSHFSIGGNVTLVKSSDAHYPGDIGKATTMFEIERRSFDEVRMALANANGRSVKIGQAGER